MKHNFYLRVAYSLITACILLFYCNTSTGQIINYTADASGALYSIATHVTATPLSRVNGATVPSSPCSTGFSSSSFPTTTSYSTTLPAVEVTLTPSTGFRLNVIGFSLELRRSGSGPASVRLAYSIDGGLSWIDEGVDHAPSNTSCGTTIAVAWTTLLTVTAPSQLKFRAYGFNAASTSGSLQIMNLIVNGTVASTSGCTMPSGLFFSGITSTAATMNWIPVSGALSYDIRYRQTGTIPWTTLSSAGVSTSVSALTPNTAYDYQVQSRCMGTDTSGYSSTSYFTTAVSTSASSGKINIYFNNPVNNTVSTGVNAIHLSNCVADTIIAYINRARYSIDIAMYNYVQTSGFTNIATAINNAYTSGVKIRWIYDGTASNTGLSLLNPGIPRLASPTTSAYNIMHNKFVIIDANSTDPNDAIVSTGSTNWTEQQLNNDPNNILFIQDSALAHTYTSEFNMMWGDTGMVPNATLSKFGPYKTDLGRHIFNVAGKTIELYFSPSDGTNDRIKATINTANTDLYFGVYTFTLTNDANAIVGRDTMGVYTAGIVDGNSISGAAYPILTSGLGPSLKTYSGSYIYHNKMAIIDQSNTCSDPIVFNGSHNWTNAANTQNDENTLIIHDDTIANIFYQSFYADFLALGGSLSAIPPCVTPTTGITNSYQGTNLFVVYPNPASGEINFRYTLDSQAPVQLTVYDMTGRNIKEVVHTDHQQTGSYTYTVDLPARGIFIAKLSIGANILIQKVIKL